MPIYEYVCPHCNAKFEQMRPLSQSGQDAECPKCHKPSRRKISSFAAFTTRASGVPTRVSGTSGSSCSGCSSGNCSTCAS
jgi:putative FmdB family regulatory protein